MSGVDDMTTERLELLRCYSADNSCHLPYVAAISELVTEVDRLRSKVEAMGIVVDKPAVGPKPQYGMIRRNGTIRVFPSKTAAVNFNRELAPWALQYYKGVHVSTDGGETWGTL